MIATAIALLVASAGPALAPGAPVRLAQFTVRERVVIHLSTRAPPPPPPVSWRERKGPHCIATSDIGAAGLQGGDMIDFILRGGIRIRAKLDSACPSLSYYGGFYLRPGEDGQICQGRDAVHARSGGECMISRFRLLTPKAPK